MSAAMKKNKYRGFTLIELLVVISIIGILIALSLFGLIGARESARDSRRKSDLELIRSGLELYKSDCGSYPTTTQFNYGPWVEPGVNLTGDGSSDSCSSSNVYITSAPEDPLWDSRGYSYRRPDAYHYSLCAALEHVPSPAPDLSLVCSACSEGSVVATCNYQVTNP